jgi:hypothetical protein
MRKNGESAFGSQCGIDRGDTALDLRPDPLQWQPLQSERMILGMSADGMASIVDAPDNRRILVRHPPNEEISGLNALRSQNIQKDVAVGRQRPVIKSENHFMVIKRQSLLVLHTANFIEFAWTDGEDATRAERVWIPWATVC